MVYKIGTLSELNKLPSMDEKIRERISENLEILDDTKLDFILDVTGLEPGNHTLNLKLETSQRVQLTSDILVKIRIDEK